MWESQYVYIIEDLNFMVQGGTCDSFELMFEMILYATHETLHV